MSKRPSPEDAEAFAQWLMQGLRETVRYRLNQTFSPEQVKQQLLSHLERWVPTRGQLLHRVLQPAFEKEGFQFEELRFGDTPYHLIRKKIRPGDRRLVLVPGFGDTPASWLPIYLLARKTIQREFDEVLVMDFPGYLGFLSDHQLTPSMSMLQGVVKTVCEANPPHTLIGHSLGGWITSKFAQSFSKRPVPHLIAIAPSGLTPVEERQDFGDFILEGQSLTIQELLKRVVYDPKPYQVLLKEEFKAFYSQEEIRQFIESVEPHEFLNPEQPIGAERVSVIWGDSDQFVPTQWMRHWIEKYGPLTDAFLMAKTGHLPQLERPVALAEILVQAFEDQNKIEGKNWKRLHERQKRRASLSEPTAPKRIVGF